MGVHQGKAQIVAVSGRAGARLVHLDALRAFCMFYGILSHGATLDHDGHPGLDLIRLSSDLFRMATFFLVGGFLTALVATRTPAPAYLRGRARLLLLPLVTSLVTLVPLTNYLIHRWHNGPVSLRAYFLEGGWQAPSLGNDVWHLHLWFLFALFAYAVLTPALLAVLRRPAVRQGVDRYVRRTGRWTLWGNVLLVALAVLAMRALDTLVAGPLLHGTPWDFIARATLTYFPYFALGVAMFTNAALFRSMHCFDARGLAISLALFLVARYGDPDMPWLLNRLLLWTGKAGIIMFTMAALLDGFERAVRRPSPALDLFVGGAFTFYLFHMTGIYLVATLAGPWLDDLLLTFAFVVLVVPPLVLVLHARVIAPNPWLRLAYNGRPPHRSALAATA